MASRAVKRARGPGAGAAAGPALTAAECSRMVQRLSEGDARAILAELVSSSSAARGAVEAGLKRLEEAPLKLEEYSRRASEILWSLEGLRSSQIYSRSGEVSEKLADLLDECTQQLSRAHAFQAIVTIMACVQGEAEGELRKCVLGCGGFDSDVARELTVLVGGMSEEEKASIEDTVEELDGVADALADFGCGFGLAEVARKVRGE